MISKGPSSASTLFALLFTVLLNAPPGLFAHCDGMDGPVVKAAQRALERGDVNLVLVWVQKDDEARIRQAFKKALTFRKLGPDEQEFADQYFFETLVRIHRAGEGAPYTGLKPARRDLGSAIPAAVRALAEGSPKPAAKLLTERVQAGLRERFERALAKKSYRSEDVNAGREYVKAYVEFIH